MQIQIQYIAAKLNVAGKNQDEKTIISIFFLKHLVRK